MELDSTSAETRCSIFIRRSRSRARRGLSRWRNHSPASCSRGPWTGKKPCSARRIRTNWNRFSEEAEAQAAGPTFARRRSRGRVCSGCRHVQISAGDTYGYNRGDPTRPRGRWCVRIVMIGLSKSEPSVAALPASEVDRTYRRERRRVFVGIFAGYAAYYLVRNNLALAIPDILREHPQYSRAQLGMALTGLSIAYGVSKFLMGSVSDRNNPKYFLPLGLLLSCTIM